MTADADDLAAFLRARYDEEERTANGAGGGVWTTDTMWVTLGNPDDGRIPISTYVWNSDRLDYEDVAAHIANHDPAHELLVVKANRAILEAHQHYPAGDGHGCGICAWDSRHGEIHDARWCLTVKMLALPYSNRPDFRETWRPAPGSEPGI